jgi:hypothetical protein
LFGQCGITEQLCVSDGRDTRSFQLANVSRKKRRKRRFATTGSIAGALADHSGVGESDIFDILHSIPVLHSRSGRIGQWGYLNLDRFAASTIDFSILK